MNKLLKIFGLSIFALVALVLLLVTGVGGYIYYWISHPEQVAENRKEFLAHPEKSLFYKFITGDEERDPSCFARDVVIVKIGETVLAVPRKYRASFQAAEDQKLPYARGTNLFQLCQRMKEPPILVKGVSVDRYEEQIGFILNDSQRYENPEDVWQQIKERSEEIKVFNKPGRPTLKHYPFNVVNSQDVQIVSELIYNDYKSVSYAVRYNEDIIIIFTDKVNLNAESNDSSAIKLEHSLKRRMKYMQEEAEQILKTNM